MANPRPAFIVTIVLLVLVVTIAVLVVIHHGPPPTTVTHPGFTTGVIVQVSDSLSLPYVDHAENGLSGTALSDWTAVSSDFPDVHLDRLFTHVSGDTLKAWSDSARAHDPHFHEPSLTSFFRVQTPAGSNQDSLRARIRQLPFVVFAYPEPVPTVADCETGRINAPGNSDAWKQAQYETWDLGVAVTSVWPYGGAGKNVRFVDLEEGWGTDDADIPYSEPTIGLNARNQDHGTAVLGIVCAKDDGAKCVGIAPCCATTLASCCRTATVHFPIGDVVNKVADMSPRPHVLLIEMQEPFLTDDGYLYDLPAEVDPATRVAIHVATERHITVIEVAGNGKHNLDAVRVNGAQPLVRPSADSMDSGAIIVAAANPSMHTITRYDLSNYGTRIDCFAWGSNVFSDGPAGQNSSGDGIFTRTSAAAAIVAGAAVSLVSLGLAHGLDLDPPTVRAWLSDPTTGRTSQDRIGVMPNLKRIAIKHSGDANP